MLLLIQNKTGEMRFVAVPMPEDKPAAVPAGPADTGEPASGDTAGELEALDDLE